MKSDGKSKIMRISAAFACTAILITAVANCSGSNSTKPPIPTGTSTSTGTDTSTSTGTDTSTSTGTTTGDVESIECVTGTYATGYMGEGDNKTDGEIYLGYGVTPTASFAWVKFDLSGISTNSAATDLWFHYNVDLDNFTNIMVNMTITNDDPQLVNTLTNPPTASWVEILTSGTGPTSSPFVAGGAVDDFNDAVASGKGWIAYKIFFGGSGGGNIRISGYNSGYPPVLHVIWQE